jgi:hypothetical protein
MTTCDVVEMYRNFGETRVNFDKTTRRHIIQDGTLHSHLCQNLRYNSEQEKWAIHLPLHGNYTLDLSLGNMFQLV